MKKLAIALIVICFAVICAVSFSGCSVDEFGSTVGGWFESIKTAVSDWVNSWFDGGSGNIVPVDDVDLDIDHIIFP